MLRPCAPLCCSGHCLLEKTLTASVSVPAEDDEEEEEPSSPIQEMCGKCDQPIDVRDYETGPCHENCS